MTTTRVRDNVLSVQITNNFVKQAVKSCTNSKRYINTMLRAAIINILYHRLNIDEKEFVTKIFNNISYKTFRQKSNHVLIREFHTYMLACKDALEKNYLKQFYLYFIDVATGDIMENYKFYFQYGQSDDDQVPAATDQNLIASTCELLRNLEDFKRHGKTDLEIQIKVEFTYFDDTPQDYEPPGFRNINENDSLLKKLERDGNSVLIGTLYTGFHTLKCRGRGQVYNFEVSPIPGNESSSSIVPIEQIEDNSEQDHGISQYSVRVAINSPLMTEDTSSHLIDSEDSVVNKRLQLQENKSLKMNDTYVSNCIDLSSDEEIDLDCPCKLPELNESYIDKITCATCKRLYHAPCQGYLDNTFVGGIFSCRYCKGDVDTEMEGMDKERLKALSRIRYLLGILYKHKGVPLPVKRCFDQQLKKIDNLNIFRMKGNKVEDVINREFIEGLFHLHYREIDMERFKNASIEI